VERGEGMDIMGEWEDNWGEWEDNWGAWEDNWGEWEDNWGAWEDNWGVRGGRQPRQPERARMWEWGQPGNGIRENEVRIIGKRKEVGKE
jgi:hypothetical protein